ncbi:MAG TPA: hypothetical protein PKC28_07800 [Bdellovibrionales bacterium]|nr:hypothetical protein [Bdellovibrionales bacterium]
MKQLNLFKEKRQIEFGGSLLVGKRRARRPIATKSPTHLVLKATTSFRLLRRRRPSGCSGAVRLLKE